MATSRPPEGFIDMPGAMRYSGYSRETIRLACALGELKGHQVKRKAPWFFRTEDLDVWLGIRAKEDVA